MSWAQIKKSINSDLTTPLNTLITNKTKELSSPLSAIKSDVTTITNRACANFLREYIATEKGAPYVDSTLSSSSWKTLATIGSISNNNPIEGIFIMPSIENVSFKIRVDQQGPSASGVLSFTPSSENSKWMPVFLNYKFAECIKTCGLRLYKTSKSNFVDVSTSFTPLVSTADAEQYRGCIIGDRAINAYPIMVEARANQSVTFSVAVVYNT